MTIIQYLQDVYERFDLLSKRGGTHPEFGGVCFYSVDDINVCSMFVDQDRRWTPDPE